MAPRQPKAGETYQFKGLLDVDDPEGTPKPLGRDSGALLPNTAVTVREVVPAEEPGAHNDSEDSVVIEWDRPAIMDDQSVGSVTQAMSISLERFPDWFERLS